MRARNLSKSASIVATGFGVSESMALVIPPDVLKLVLSAVARAVAAAIDCKATRSTSPRKTANCHFVDRVFPP